MLVDWFTVGAQAVNFFVLVWLMKRFLYKPILNAIDEREKHVAAELADADAKKAEAQKESEEFKQRNEEFDKQRGALLSKAQDEANVERKRLLDDARKAADELKAKRQAALKDEETEIREAIRRKTQQEVFSISRKALSDLAGASLETRIVEVFLSQLRALSAEDKGVMAAETAASGTPAVVRTTFDLSEEQTSSTEAAIKEILGAEAQVQFETTPNLLSGIELSTSGRKVTWSISDYLQSLEKGLDELLKAKVEPVAKSDSEPDPKAKVESTKPETAKQ